MKIKVLKIKNKNALININDFVKDLFDLEVLIIKTSSYEMINKLNIFVNDLNLPCSLKYLFITHNGNIQNIDGDIFVYGNESLDRPTHTIKKSLSQLKLPFGCKIICFYKYRGKSFVYIPPHLEKEIEDANKMEAEHTGCRLIDYLYRQSSQIATGERLDLKNFYKTVMRLIRNEYDNNDIFTSSKHEQIQKINELLNR